MRLELPQRPVKAENQARYQIALKPFHIIGISNGFGMNVGVQLLV